MIFYLVPDLSINVSICQRIQYTLKFLSFRSNMFNQTTDSVKCPRNARNKDQPPDDDFTVKIRNVWYIIYVFYVLYKFYMCVLWLASDVYFTIIFFSYFIYFEIIIRIKYVS